MRISGTGPQTRPCFSFREVKNIEKIKEKRTVKKGLKEKVKSVPKQLVRRGLDDGTERLRGQLRDTAQRGQTDNYGGDRIEDTAVGGVRRAERGIENLLKKKRAGKRDTPQDRTPLKQRMPTFRTSLQQLRSRRPRRSPRASGILCRSADGRQRSNRRKPSA